MPCFYHSFVKSSRGLGVKPVLGSIRHLHLFIATAAWRRLAASSLDAIYALQALRHMCAIVDEVEPIDGTEVRTPHTFGRIGRCRNACGLLCLEVWSAVGGELEVGLGLRIEVVVTDQVEEEWVLDAALRRLKVGTRDAVPAERCDDSGCIVEVCECSVGGVGRFLIVMSNS